MSSTMVVDRTINRIRGVDWTGQKRVSFNSKLTNDITVGEVAEAIRERMQLPRGSYAVYHEGRKLARSATLAEAELREDAELELSPEVKAGGSVKSVQR